MYRDPLQAAQSQVERAFERAAAREERVSAALVEQLPVKLRRKLLAARKRAMRERSGLDGLRDSEKALDAYAGVLDEVIERAPRLEKRFNRLPRFYPDRVKPRHPFLYADIYSPAVEKLRGLVHAAIRQHDPKARIFDLRPRYYDQHVEPFVVEACFKAHGAPLRLHIVPRIDAGANANQAFYGNNMLAYVSMLTLVRSSTPKILLEHQHWGKKLLKLLKLQADTAVGRPRIDDMFIISALPDDAERVLNDAVCQALLELARISVPTLEIDDGLARVEWRETVEDSQSIDAAARLLSALRQIAPTPLLMRKKR